MLVFSVGVLGVYGYLELLLLSLIILKATVKLEVACTTSWSLEYFIILIMGEEMYLEWGRHINIR